MKPLFFFLFVCISYTTTAQLPKEGHNGYKKTTYGGMYYAIVLENNRNTFVRESIGDIIDQYRGPEDSLNVVSQILSDSTYFYNHRYYYSDFILDNHYCHVIVIYNAAVELFLGSKYNDAEFARCKRMLDKEADIVIKEQEKKDEALAEDSNSIMVHDPRHCSQLRTDLDVLYGLYRLK